MYAPVYLLPRGLMKILRVMSGPDRYPRRNREGARARVTIIFFSRQGWADVAARRLVRNPPQAFSKLLRRLSVLRRRWRQMRRQKEAGGKGHPGSSLKVKSGSTGGSDGDGSSSASMGYEIVTKSTKHAGIMRDGDKGSEEVKEDEWSKESGAPDKEELEMACR